MPSVWHPVVSAATLKSQGSFFVDIGEVTVAVFYMDDTYYAVEDACSHDGSRMLSCGVEAKFLLHDDRLMCPRHGAEFCIRSGKALSPPAREDIQTFPIREQQGQIEVCIED